MIRGPWPMTPDRMRYDIPLDRPYLTPMFNGERVALRVSQADHDKLGRWGGFYGIITDLDTGRRYELRGISCGEGRCNCDAEIKEIQAC